MSVKSPASEIVVDRFLCDEDPVMATMNVDFNLGDDTAEVMTITFSLEEWWALHLQFHKDKEGDCPRSIADDDDSVCAAKESMKLSLNRKFDATKDKSWRDIEPVVLSFIPGVAAADSVGDSTDQSNAKITVKSMWMTKDDGTNGETVIFEFP